jgi:hypothetical protein
MAWGILGKIHFDVNKWKFFCYWEWDEQKKIDMMSVEWEINRQLQTKYNKEERNEMKKNV